MLFSHFGLLFASGLEYANVCIYDVNVKYSSQAFNLFYFSLTTPFFSLWVQSWNAWHFHSEVVNKMRRKNLPTLLCQRKKKQHEKNIFISIELDLWGNHIMRESERKTKCENVFQMKLCCLSQWNKHKLKQTCCTIVTAYLIYANCTFHFTLFMIQRRVWMSCKTIERQKKHTHTHQ